MHRALGRVEGWENITLRQKLIDQLRGEGKYTDDRFIGWTT